MRACPKPWAMEPSTLGLHQHGVELSATVLHRGVLQEPYFAVSRSNSTATICAPKAKGLRGRL